MRPFPSGIAAIGFALTGLVTTLLGALLPVLSARLALGDDAAGALFAAQFLGSTLGVLASGWVVPRWGYRGCLVLGYALMALGVAGFAAGRWPTSPGSVLGYGLGLGFTIPTTNLAFAAAHPTRRAAVLNLLNLGWGLGAVTCPMLYALFQRLGAAQAFLPALAVLLAAVGTGVALTADWPRPPHPGAPLSETETVTRERLPLFALFASLFFLYVGTENAVAGWVSSHTQRLGSGDAWLLAPSCFWSALLLGRAAAPAVLRRLHETGLIVLGLCLAGAGLAALIAAGGVGAVLASASIAGLGLAPVFPTTIAWMARSLGTAASPAPSTLFAFAGLGGATLPWIAGIVSTRWDSLRVALSVPLVGCLAMLALVLWTVARPGVEQRSRAG